MNIFFHITPLRLCLAAVLIATSASCSWAYDLKTREFRIHLRQAQESAAQGDAPAAIEKYKKALNLSPADRDALSGLALVEEQIGALGKAIGHWQQLLDAHPDAVAAHNHLGSIYAKQQNFALAVEAFQKCVEQAGPASAEGDAARKGLDAIAQQSPYYRDLMIKAQARQMQEMVERRVQAERIEALTQRANDYKINLARGRQAFDQGHYQDAIFFSTQALLLSPYSNDAWALKQAALLKLHAETENALTDASVSHILKP